jgi:hypothetical protein
MGTNPDIGDSKGLDVMMKLFQGWQGSTLLLIFKFYLNSFLLEK